MPKANGFLNVGLGAIAHRLKSRKDDIKNHWDPFLDKLRKNFHFTEEKIRPEGHSYYLRDKVDIERIKNTFVVGDSAGLATRNLCEGIGPAVRSGIKAADWISLGTNYDLSSINRLRNPKG